MGVEECDNALRDASKGEVNEGSAIFIDATDGKKALKYEVTKMAALPSQEEMHASESVSDRDEEMVPPPREVKHVHETAGEVVPPPKEVKKHVQKTARIISPQTRIANQNA